MDFINKHREIVVLGVILLGLIGLTALNRNTEDTSTQTAETTSEQNTTEESPSESTEEAAEPTEEVATSEVDQAPAVPEQSAENAEGSSDEEGTQPQTDTSDYNYTARSGDSYSKLARKAVQTYGINTNTNLSQSQIVAAETYLASGKSELNEGQAVTLARADVEAAVKKAQALSEDQQALWQKYTVGVDFDTSKVGQ